MGKGLIKVLIYVLKKVDGTLHVLDLVKIVCGIIISCLPKIHAVVFVLALPWASEDWLGNHILTNMPHVCSYNKQERSLYKNAGISSGKSLEQNQRVGKH